MHLNLFQRINEVRKTNEYIQKDKRVGEGGYMAVTHDNVTASLRKDLIAQGVIIMPSVVSGTQKTVDTGMKTAKGAIFVRFEAEFSVSFINADDPKDRESVIIPAHAIDQGDKAPGKALSYATKYALLKVFSIETGEDDEGRYHDEGKPGMDEKTVVAALMEIAACDAVGTLQAAFTKAYKEAQKVDDKAAMERITKAKDQRKAQLAKPKEPA